MAQTSSAASANPAPPFGLAKARREAATARENGIWDEVQRRQAENGCTCDLTSGMTYRELIALEEGCTGSRQKGSPGWVCPVLAYYRERVR